MIYYKLTTLENVNSLCKICDKYKDDMDIDVIYGRYTIDGCSVLGVASVLGNTVNIVPNTDDKGLKKSFTEDIKKIGAYTE